MHITIVTAGRGGEGRGGEEEDKEEKEEGEEAGLVSNFHRMSTTIQDCTHTTG